MGKARQDWREIRSRSPAGIPAGLFRQEAMVCVMRQERLDTVVPSAY